MCFFITATLPAEADLVAVRTVVGPEGSSWTLLTNAYVQNQLPKGSRYFLLTGSSCDCQSALVRGDVARGKSLKLPRHAAAWTQTKRDRWLEQRGALIEGRESAARGDVIAWHEYLKRVLRSAGRSPVGLMIHFYSGSGDDERLTVTRRPSLVLNAMPPSALQNLEPDVLYEFS
jgi:hypothetical protein